MIKQLHSYGNTVYNTDSMMVGLAFGDIDDESEQLAKLFASAPKMLQALQDCITDADATCIARCNIANLRRRIMAINLIAMAAIANATKE